MRLRYISVFNICFSLLFCSGQAGAGEFIRDGGFELGIVGLDINRFPRYSEINKPGESEIPRRVNTNPIEGNYSLLLPGLKEGGYLLIYQTFPLHAEQAYEIKLMVHSQSPADVNLEIFSAGWSLVKKQQYRIGAGTKQLTLIFRSAGAPLMNKNEVAHLVRAWISSKNDVLVDSVSLRGDYGVSGEITQPLAWLTPSKTIGVYAIGESGKFYCNYLSIPGYTFYYDIYDPIRKQLIAQRTMLDIQPDEKITNRSITLKTGQRGYFQVRLYKQRYKGIPEQNVMLSYVVIDPSHVSSSNRIFFGLAFEETSQPTQVNALTSPEELYALANAIGAGTARVFSLAMPDVISLDGRSYNFTQLDEALALLKRRAIEPFVVLGSNWIERIPKWMRLERDNGMTIDLMAGAKVTRVRENLKRQLVGRYFDLSAYQRYLEKVFVHLKGKVKYYELWNEPGYKFDSNDFSRIARITREALRRIDPQASLIGFSSTIDNDFGHGLQSDRIPGFADKLASTNLQDIDILSFHGPHAFDFMGQNFDRRNLESGYAQRLRMVFEKYKTPELPLWDTEMGLSWPSPHNNRIDIDAGTEISKSEYEKTNERDVLNVARQLPMVYAAAAANGVSRLVWFNFDGANADLAHAERRWNFFDGQMEPMPQIAVYDAMTEILGGAIFAKRVEKPDGTRAYVFSKDHDCIVLVYNWMQKPSTLAVKVNQKKYKILDIMGNHAPSPAAVGNGDMVNIDASDWPSYIVIENAQPSALVIN